MSTAEWLRFVVSHSCGKKRRMNGALGSCGVEFVDSQVRKSGPGAPGTRPISFESDGAFSLQKMRLRVVRTGCYSPMAWSVLMSMPLQAFCWVQGSAGADQNSSVDGRPRGSHAAEHRYRLPVEMYGSPMEG